MSGHSKWHNIAAKKGKADAARGKIFTKLGRELLVAVKEGGPDPAGNSKLKDVIAKCKANNMPNDTINNAIKKAAGAGNTESYEEVMYEGYGTSGVAVIVEASTDNRNRTASQVRSSFTKAGGNLGTDGSVSYMFERRGSIVIAKEYDEDTMMMASLDAGALDFETVEDGYVITTPADKFTAVKEALETAGVKEFQVCEITYVPNMEVTLDEEGAEKVHRLVDTLEDLDDVQDVYYNLKED